MNRKLRTLFKTSNHIFSLADGNPSPTFDINQSYVELLGNWGMLVMSFYFGSRGIEKIVDIAGKYRNRKENG